MATEQRTGAPARPAAARPYPPPPWTLAGPVAIVPGLVPLAAARELVPRALAIVPVAPGRTLGALILVSYRRGSTLVYSELVAACALVRRRAQAGIWVSGIWVDSEASLAGGRELWGLPKELAEFAGTPGDGRFEARRDGRLLAAIELRAPARRLPAWAPVSVHGSGGRFTLGRMAGRLAPARARVEVPRDSPLAPLGLGGERRLVAAGEATRMTFPPARVAR